MDGREFLDVKYIFERANFSEKIRLEVRVSTFVIFFNFDIPDFIQAKFDRILID